MTQEFIALFDRDLKKLADEIKLYQSEDQVWILKGEIRNSAGNLCLHLIGNLNHFMGAIMGETGYVRDRKEEFSKKNVPIARLEAEILKTRDVVMAALKKISDADLVKTYPVEMFGGPIKTGHFLLHLYGHLNYHLGQLNYHRRLTGE